MVATNTLKNHGNRSHKNRNPRGTLPLRTEPPLRKIVSPGDTRRVLRAIPDAGRRETFCSGWPRHPFRSPTRAFAADGLPNLFSYIAGLFGNPVFDVAGLFGDGVACFFAGCGCEEHSDTHANPHAEEEIPQLGRPALATANGVRRAFQPIYSILVLFLGRVRPVVDPITNIAYGFFTPARLNQEKSRSK